MNILPLMISGAVIVLFALLLFSTIRSSRERLARQEKKASALGFRPLETAPPGLTERLRSIRLSGRKGQLKLEHVYHRADFDQDFYLVDVVDSSDDQGQWLGPDTLVVISPNLALPRFTLFSLPEMEHDGMMVNLVERMLDSAFSWMAGAIGFDRIDFPSAPEFNQRYVVFGRNPASVRSLFSRSLTDYLLGISLPLTVEGEGDLFAVGLSYTDHGARQAGLNDLYREVIDLARVLKDSA